MIFFDTNGKKLTEKAQIEKASSGHLDYQYELTNCIGGATMQGGREYQEDRMLAELLDKPYQDLTDKERQVVLKSCFASLNDAIREEESGSTGVVAVIDPVRQNLIVANLGDSQTCITALNSDNKFVTNAKRINKLHNVSNATEKKRIEEAGSKVIWDRIGGDLAVSRAFGDTIYEPGLSHTPEIKLVAFNTVKPNKQTIEQYVIIVSSDGLDTVTLNSCTLDDILQKSGEQYSARHFAASLCERAIYYNSDDNVSAQVAIVPAKPPKDAKPILLAVFDGHGDETVSNYLHQNFMHYFNMALSSISDNPF